VLAAADLASNIVINVPELWNNSAKIFFDALGKPILMAVESDASDLIMRSKGGVLAKSEDLISISNSIESMQKLPVDELERIGMNNKNYYNKNLSIETGAEKFQVIFNNVIYKNKKNY